jgi:cytochrome c oxidase cbb3-type subunit 3
VVFAFVYLIFYPGLGSKPGTLNWSSSGQHAAEMERARAQMAPVYAKFTAMPAEALAKDPQAMAIGERLYANNCSQCHGSDARGSKGFPNLTDNDWLYGGSHETIKTTISGGRQGNMPPMAAAVGTAEDVKNVANYVLSLSGSPHNSVAAQLGKPKFAVCAACHGADGKGMQALGAPNLTDKIWLHGWGEQAIVNIVTNGKVNMMPAQAQRLNPEQIHVLAAYVWNLSQSSTVAAK